MKRRVRRVSNKPSLKARLDVLRKAFLKKASSKRSRIPEALMVLGAFLMLVSGVHGYLYNRALSFGEDLVETYVQEVQRSPAPVHIFIQWFVDVPVSEEAFADGKWGISDTEASHLVQSANPGENGNIIIYGHNTRQILGNIRALKGSERIHVTTSDGADHVYVVQTIKEVDPNQTEFLEPTDTEVLTLYTCSGLFDSKRFIVRAVPEGK